MNLHMLKWDEESALWRTRVLKNVDPNEPMIPLQRDTQPWLAWNTPESRRGQVEFVELQSVAAAISPAGDILLYYRPAVEYWRNINPQAARQVKWLEQEWPMFGEVALEQLNNIALAISEQAQESDDRERRLHEWRAASAANDEC